MDLIKIVLHFCYFFVTFQLSSAIYFEECCINNGLKLRVTKGARQRCFMVDLFDVKFFWVQCRSCSLFIDTFFAHREEQEEEDNEEKMRGGRYVTAFMTTNQKGSMTHYRFV